MVLVFLLLCITIGSYERNMAHGQSLEAGQESIKIEESRSVNLTWRIKKEPTATRDIYLTEEIGPKKKVLLPKSFPLTPYHKIRFGERLKLYLGGEENVTVQLKNSTYNDTCTLSLVVFFRHGEDETIMYSATRIQICGPKGSPCTEAAQDGTSAVLIAGATVGSLLFIVILILIVVVLVRREYKLKHSKMSRKLSSVFKQERSETKEPPPTQLYEGDGEYTAIDNIQYQDLQHAQQEYDYAYSPSSVQEQENYLTPTECLQEESEHKDLLDNGESIYENTKNIHQSREKEKGKPKKIKNKPPTLKKPNVAVQKGNQIGFRKTKTGGEAFAYWRKQEQNNET